MRILGQSLLIRLRRLFCRHRLRVLIDEQLHCVRCGRES